MATAPQMSTIPVGEYDEVAQPNYGYPPNYGGAPPPYSQSQTRIISNTNPQPTIIATPAAQPNVIVVGRQPQYVVVNSACIEEESEYIFFSKRIIE